jgi:methionyl-tRNA formyltransferase
VKNWAEAKSIPVFQPAKKAELDKLIRTQKFASPVGLVVDYGLIIPESVIDSFPYKIVNSHFSLLPEWRGADPITFAILSGQKKTGVTLMVIVPALDEGEIIAQAKYALGDDVTIHQLTNDLSALSNELLIEQLPRYVEGKVTPVPQSSTVHPTYSRKLVKADGQIDWTKPAEELERQVRAFLGWPGSFTNLRGLDATVTAAHVGPQSGTSGELFVDESGNLGGYAGQGSLIIDRLKPAGKPEMTSKAFLAGHPLK